MPPGEAIRAGASGALAFHGAVGIEKPTITGWKEGNSVRQPLSALGSYALIDDSTAWVRKRSRPGRSAPLEAIRDAFLIALPGGRGIAAPGEWRRSYGRRRRAFLSA